MKAPTSGMQSPQSLVKYGNQVLVSSGKKKDKK